MIRNKTHSIEISIEKLNGMFKGLILIYPIKGYGPMADSLHVICKVLISV